MRLLVIGVGNRWCGDDAVGLVVARRVAQLRPGLRVLEHEGEGAALLELWAGADAVTLVDAVSSSDPPGTIHRFEAQKTPLPMALFRHSTHAIGLPDAVELGRALSRLPGLLMVYGIVGASFDAGRGVSDSVERAAARVVARIAAETDAWDGVPPLGPCHA